MSPSQFTPRQNRRRALRLGAVLRVRFSINGGQPHAGTTMNVTLRSIAVRMDCDVSVGDRVIALIDDLPPVATSVIRTFDEGFAAALDKPSLAIIAHASAETAPVAESPERRSLQHIRAKSLFFKLDGSTIGWARLATSADGFIKTARHYVSFVLCRRIISMDIVNCRLSIGEDLTLARIHRVFNLGDESISTILLNDAQLRASSETGLILDLEFCNGDELDLQIRAKDLASHLAVASSHRNQLVA